MGAHPTANIDPTEPGVSFLVGVENVHVLILEPEDLAKRNAIIDALLNLSTLKGRYQLLYLAAPRLLGATIDAGLFRSRGIGLLFFDERRIDEAVPPQPMQLGTVLVAQPSEDKAVATELATLKSMYLEMERTLNQLRDDLTGLRHAPLLRDDVTHSPQSVHAINAQPVFVHEITQSGPLPSYFANNPWLEVLAKRGNGEHEAIAG